MRFDDYAFPCDSGSSDSEDSSRLAGVLSLFDYPAQFSLLYYFNREDDGDFATYRRCKNSKYDFSRDQFICLAAGLSKGYQNLISFDRVTGKDFMSPTVKGHAQRCKGLKASWWQDLWLMAEMLVHAKLSPLSESNQILCMVIVAGDNWLNKYCKMNLKWRDSVNLYWRDSYRSEPELAKHMIDFIEKRIK